MALVITDYQLSLINNDIISLKQNLNHLRESQDTLLYVKTDLENWSEYGNFGVELRARFDLYLRNYESRINSIELKLNFLEKYAAENVNIQSSNY